MVKSIPQKAGNREYNFAMTTKGKRGIMEKVN